MDGITNHEVLQQPPSPLERMYSQPTPENAQLFWDEQITRLTELEGDPQNEPIAALLREDKSAATSSLQSALKAFEMDTIVSALQTEGAGRDFLRQAVRNGLGGLEDTINSIYRRVKDPDIKERLLTVDNGEDRAEIAKLIIDYKKKWSTYLI